MQTTCLCSSPLARRSKKRGQGKKIPQGLSQNFTAVFLSTHKNQTVSLHWAAVCNFPKNNHCKVSEQWQLSQLYPLAQAHPETRWGRVRGCCWLTLPLPKWADVRTPQSKIPAQKQPSEVGKAKHQCIMARRVLRERTSALQLRKLLSPGNCLDDFQLAAEFPQAEHFTGVCSRPQVQSTLNSLSYDKKGEFGWLTWTGSTQLIQEYFFYSCYW